MVRPIVLGNFLLKIFTKIMADRLAYEAGGIVLGNQFGFVCGHHIKDSIAAISNCVTLFDHRCFGGKLALKVNILKAFDLMDWNFIFAVFYAFGFLDTWISWLNNIFGSTRISILLKLVRWLSLL